MLFRSLRQLITDMLCRYRYNRIGNICIFLYIIADSYLAHCLKEYRAEVTGERHLQLHLAYKKFLRHGDTPAARILRLDIEKKASSTEFFT